MCHQIYRRESWQRDFSQKRARLFREPRDLPQPYLPLVHFFQIWLALFSPENWIFSERREIETPSQIFHEKNRNEIE